MNYHWTECPNCGCHVAVNWIVRPEGVFGSLRRWSTDRAVNDGKPFSAPRMTPGFAVSCVCGATISLPERPDAVGGERSDDLRVTLTSD